MTQRIVMNRNVYCTLVQWGPQGLRGEFSCSLLKHHAPGGMLLLLVCILLLPTLSTPLPRLVNERTACCFLIWIEILVDKKPWYIGQGFGLRILLDAYLLNEWIVSDFFLGENVTFHLPLFSKDPCFMHWPQTQTTQIPCPSLCKTP